MALPRTLVFSKNPYLWTQHKFHEYPSFSWAIAMCVVSPIAFLAQDQIRRHVYGFHEPAPMPKTYQTPDRPRRPVPSTYNDPA